MIQFKIRPTRFTLGLYVFIGSRVAIATVYVSENSGGVVEPYEGYKLWIAEYFKPRYSYSLNHWPW